jgi:hypothetical protein
MLNNVLLYAGSLIIFVWGVAHIIPTPIVVAGYGPLSEDNRRMITMEWVAEGLSLCFIGVLVALVTLLGGAANPVSRLVYGACTVMALVMGGWTFAIGWKTTVLPIKLCPFVLIIVAVLFFLGSSLPG